MLAIETADGPVEALLATAPQGTGPGVLLFMDAFGLRLARARAEFVFGHADHDGSMTPENVADLGAALAAAGLLARNEVYADAQHGYTMADTAAWNEQAFLRAFAHLRDLFDRTLR